MYKELSTLDFWDEFPAAIHRDLLAAIRKSYMMAIKGQGLYKENVIGMVQVKGLPFSAEFPEVDLFMKFTFRREVLIMERVCVYTETPVWLIEAQAAHESKGGVIEADTVDGDFID